MSTTISKTVTHKISMGPYETMEVGATVEMFDVEDPNEALDAINAVINEALDDDLDEVRKLANDKSYIQNWRVPE